MKKHTQEDASRRAEEEEKAIDRQERRDRYYKNADSTIQYKRRPHIFLFQPEDLDNEDIILAVENTPTYKRTRQMLEDIRKQGQDKEHEEKKKESEPIQGSISFASNNN